MMKQTFDDLSKIRILTALTSLIISTLAIYTDDILNSDGILYIGIAQAYTQGGLTKIVEYTGFGWPFFSILLSYLHQITSFSIETSAYIINTIFAILLTDTLLLISVKILSSNRQVTIAALFILCFYSLNEYRDFIIRDVGYWAFCSLVLYQFILFTESNSVKNATFWQLFAVTAILFRIEGVFILLALPLYLFFIHQPAVAIRKIILLNYLIIIGAIAGLVVTMNYLGTTNAFGKISTIIHYLDIQQIFNQLSSRADILEEQVLNKDTADYGKLILISGLLTMLVFKLIKAMSFGYLAIFVHSFWKKNHILPAYQNKNLLTYFASIHILILVILLFNQYFLSKRYAMMALLSLLLLMLPRLVSWMDEAWKSKKISHLIFVVLIFFLSIADTLTSSTSKAYIKNTAIWANGNIPVQSTILTDNKFSYFYFGGSNNSQNITLGTYKTYQDYDYLLTIEKIKNKGFQLTLQKMNLELIYCDKNERNDKSCVYKIIQN